MGNVTWSYSRYFALVPTVFLMVKGILCWIKPETAAKKKRVECMKEKGTLKTFGIWQGLLEVLGGVYLLVMVCFAEEKNTIWTMCAIAVGIGVMWRLILCKVTTGYWTF